MDDVPPDEVVIKVRLDGPYKVTGPVTLTDHEGNEIAVPRTGDPKKDAAIVLCRCGHSGTKPFCDSTHKKIGFHG